MTRLFRQPGPRSGASRPTLAGAVLASVLLVELASCVTQGFLSPLLKALTDLLRVTAAELNWIGVVSLVAGAVFTPVLSRLGNHHGHPASSG
ncbi:hypothetical protein ACWEP8_28450 [Streptomyces hydrogenans]